MKKIIGLIALLALVTMCVVACGGTTTSSGGTSTATSGNTVGLESATFAKSNITIKKGQSITLLSQTNVVHIVANGTWQGNTPDPQSEAGAPIVNSVMFSSNNQSLAVGPFNTSGTFHYYCSVHTDMNLTVIVQ
jgi:plastocyanin